jgi:hypothetical protein
MVDSDEDADMEARTSKSTTKSSSKKKRVGKKLRKGAGGQQQQQQLDLELARKIVKTQEQLLKLLTKNNEPQLQTQQQQDTFFKTSHNITSAFKILQIITTIQVIDSKLPGIS